MQMDLVKLEHILRRATTKPLVYGFACEPPTIPVGPQHAHDAGAERHALIEKLAYHFAEERGFAPGGELQDWLRAEAEVDEWLEGTHYSGD